MGISRRDLLRASAAGAVLGGIGLSRIGRAAEETIKFGFLAPLTGPVSGWGLPGLYGCEILAERINQAGGMKIGGTNYRVELVAYDTEYNPAKAVQGFKKLVIGDGVKYVMMLGGDPWPAVQPLSNRMDMLCTTLLPSDLNPDAHNLFAPAEIHPLYVVSGVEYLRRNHPDLKNVAICAQDDSLGNPSVATYKTAFEVADIEVTKTNLFSPSTTDFAPVVTSLLATDPDIVCLDTAYPAFVNLLCQQLYVQGYRGRMVSATCDGYKDIIAKTSPEFMEGFVFNFPDFDDPRLSGNSKINFAKPAEFYNKYVERHPGEWTAVSWEYAAIMNLWQWGAERAGSVDPMRVREAWVQADTLPHIFGTSKWWGQELWGIDHALVGRWPTVEIRDSKATIVGMPSILDWCNGHLDLLVQHMKAMDLLGV